MRQAAPIGLKSTDDSRVVIVGAGIAGLLAARVLSDVFASIVIVERDRLPDIPQSRPGVPQAAHGHVVLVEGIRALAELFPGIDKDLVDAGAVSGDLCADAIVSARGTRLPRFSSDLKGLSLSRNFLEWHIRQRVMTLPNVAFRTGCTVTGFLMDDKRRRVCGVYVSGKDKGPTELVANLVVDASGARSATPRWLLSDKVAHVPETVVDAHIGYASRSFRWPEKWIEDWRVAAISWWPPQNRRGGGIYPQEGNALIASLVGAQDCIPSGTEEAFIAHARQLEDRAVYDLVRLSEPLSKIVRYRLPGNRRRTYRKVTKHVSGLLVLGDALCVLNPFYGHGMTMAALQARALQQIFSRTELWSERSFHRLVARAQEACERVLRVPWLLATTEDFRHGTEVDGVMTMTHRLARWYTDRAMGVRNKRTTMAIYRTMSLVDPYALIRPAVLVDILLVPIVEKIRVAFGGERGGGCLP